jgi:hypothetical protein
MTDASMVTNVVDDLAGTARQLRAKAASASKLGGWAGGFIVSWHALGSLIAALATLGAVLASAKLGGFLRWARTRRDLLRAAGRPVPSWRELWAVRGAERKRLAALVAQWPARCQDLGLKLGGRAPVLVDHSIDLDGNITAKLIRTGFDPDDLKAKAAKLAKALGCPSITVRETSPGCADVRFNYSDPLRRELGLADVQWPKHGGPVLGVTEHGDPAELRIDASKSFVGSSGSGKSNAALAGLCSLVAQGHHLRLYVSNPKQNEMRRFNQFVKQARGRVEVREYAETAAENKTMIANFRNAMNVRNSKMKGRKLTRTTAENPLTILFLDEKMMLPREVYKDGPYSDLGQCCLAGRASLFSVWGCTQMFYAADFGTVRNLFDERIMLRVKTKTQADTIIDGATDRGATPHKLRAKKDAGVGWIEQEESSNELVKFRAAHVTDADLDRMINGLVPLGMRTGPDPEPERVLTGREKLADVLIGVRWRFVFVLALVLRGAQAAAWQLGRVLAGLAFLGRLWGRELRIRATTPRRVILARLGRLRAAVRGRLVLAVLGAAVFLRRKAARAAVSAAVFLQLVIGMAR